MNITNEYKPLDLEFVFNTASDIVGIPANQFNIECFDEYIQIVTVGFNFTFCSAYFISKELPYGVS